jgi:hypothetical protein
MRDRASWAASSQNSPPVGDAGLPTLDKEKWHHYAVYSRRVAQESKWGETTVEFDELVLTGRAWVVPGALSGEAVIAGVAQGTCGGAGDWLLVTGSIGTGERAAQAVAALQQHGLHGVIAPAFAWPFFRVCLHLGLPPLTVWEAGEIRHGDRLRVALNGQVVKNLSSGRRYPIRNLSDLYLAILACGGMPGYLQALRTGHKGLG